MKKYEFIKSLYDIEVGYQFEVEVVRCVDICKYEICRGGFDCLCVNSLLDSKVIKEVEEG